MLRLKSLDWQLLAAQLLLCLSNLRPRCAYILGDCGHSSLALRRLRTGKSPHITPRQKHASRFVCQSTKTATKATTATRPSQFSGRESFAVSHESYRHEVGAAGASPLTSRPSWSSRRWQIKVIQTRTTGHRNTSTPLACCGKLHGELQV